MRPSMYESVSNPLFSLHMHTCAMGEPAASVPLVIRFVRSGPFVSSQGLQKRPTGKIASPLWLPELTLDWGPVAHLHRPLAECGVRKRSWRSGIQVPSPHDYPHEAAKRGWCG
eukprot:1844528-Amphidinium_carterae.1